MKRTQLLHFVVPPKIFPLLESDRYVANQPQVIVEFSKTELVAFLLPCSLQHRENLPFPDLVRNLLPPASRPTVENHFWDDQTSVGCIPVPNRAPGLFCSGNFGFETIARGRCIELALEGAVERRLGFVTDLTSNLRDTATGGREELSPQLQPPTC